VAEVSQLGRNTQGVTLIRLPDDEKLVGVVRLEASDESGGDDDGEPDDATSEAGNA
jgi:DNA gyrase subunit A